MPSTAAASHQAGGMVAIPAPCRGREQADAERDAEDGARQRGQHLRRRYPRGDLLRVAPSARASAEECLASSTVAQAVKIAFRPPG